MNFKVPYISDLNNESAYQLLKERSNEVFGKFNIPIQSEFFDEDKLIKAEGKGFKFSAEFFEESIDINLDLSLFLRPIGSKIKSVIENELSKLNDKKNT